MKEYVSAKNHNSERLADKNATEAFSESGANQNPSLKRKIRLYWPLVKGMQTGLLLATGLAGYMSARCPVINWPTLLGLVGSLFLAIGGSTILNMWYDRDVDARMQRTCRRPLPSGRINPTEALVVGFALAVAGVSWALAVDPLYGVIVFAGLFIDIVVYTVWLKRITAWSIVFGGLAGGMPVFAGRSLGLGAVDWVGAIMALAVLFWIPTHIVTYNMRYYDDYVRAGIPTFPSVYGFRTARILVAISSIMAALCMAIAVIAIGMDTGYLRLITVLTAGLLILAISSMIRPSERLNLGLFKYASFYMLSAMFLMVLEVI
jgi:protoheme IX farnesyltransferase